MIEIKNIVNLHACVFQYVNSNVSNNSIMDMQVLPVPEQPKTFGFPQRTYGLKSFNPSWFDSRPQPDETRKGVEIVFKKKLFFFSDVFPI